MLKLHHLVEDKNSCTFNRTLQFSYTTTSRWKSSIRWSRFGEMEVWALEAYGASYTLQEILLLNQMMLQVEQKYMETIVKGDDNFESGIPESFNVLVKEIRALGLNIELN